MQFRVNETLLKKQCIEAHGQGLGETVFEIELARQKKRIDDYHEMLRQRDALQIEIEALQATQSLTPQEKAMNDAYENWMVACAALEAQRVKNVQACQPLEQRLLDLRSRITATFQFRLTGKWRSARTRPS